MPTTAPELRWEEPLGGFGVAADPDALAGFEVVPVGVKLDLVGVRVVAVKIKVVAVRLKVEPFRVNVVPVTV